MYIYVLIEYSGATVQMKPAYGDNGGSLSSMPNQFESN